MLLFSLSSQHGQFAILCTYTGDSSEGEAECVCVCVFWRCWDEIEDQGFLLGYVEG